MTDQLLINTLESPGEFDVLTSLRPNEPYFVLVGRDRAAPALVQAWADQRRERALKDFDDGKFDAALRDLELRKSSQAEAIGWAMTAYKAGHEARAAEERGRETYSGHQPPEESRQRDALQSLRSRVASALNAAVSDATALAAMIVETPLFATDPELVNLAVSVGETICRMDKTSDLVKPWRPLGRRV